MQKKHLGFDQSDVFLNSRLNMFLNMLVYSVRFLAMKNNSQHCKIILLHKNTFFC